MPLVIDPDRIGQVISILVGSAIKFTPAGGHIEVRLQSAAGCAQIQVTDSGTGISREALPHVFDRFPRASGVGTRVGEGLDVGLAVVKDLVELHGGRVSVESQGPGRGATFTIELPSRPEERGADPWRTGQHADGRLAGIHVLLVDQDFGLCESVQAVLETYGAEVTAVTSAPAALDDLERSRPDVLLFGDLAVPGESIADLMREVTARACPLPIASISTRNVKQRNRERGAGFRMHLTTPLEMGTLVEAVADLAGRR